MHHTEFEAGEARYRQLGRAWAAASIQRGRWGGTMETTATADIAGTEIEPESGPGLGSTEPTPPGPPKRLGILVLHGMGEHRRGDTLRRFGEPIYAWLDSWRAASNPACTLFTDDTSLRLPRLDEPDAPPHTRITITWPDTVNPNGPPLREQTWIAAEAWWADEFNPPPFSEVASWSMALAPGLLVNYIEAGLGRSRFWKWLALPLGYLAAGLFQLILLALLVIGIVPPLRKFVAGIQVTLTGALGDPLVMVASPIRFNAILSRIERNLRWLREDQGCERIAVVAHSQGTGIGLRVLQRRSDRVHLFVTFGTAIEKLHIAAELQAIRRRLGIAITVSAVSLVLIVAAWILAVIVFDQPLLWWIVPCVPIMLLVGVWITWWSGQQIAKVGPPDLTVPVQSKDGEVEETAPLVWRDFWTISDPFPDEGLPRPWDGPTPPDLRHIDRVSSETHNRSALLKDHSIYEENHEGLVGPVFARLAALAELEAGLPERLTPALTAAQGRRRIRVRALAFSRWIVAGAAILLPLLSIARGELESIGRPIRTSITAMSGWLGIEAIVEALDEETWVSTVIGGALVAILVGAWYRLAISRGWRIWDKAEADRLAIGLLALPVAEGPFVLDAGKGSDRGGMRETNTPGEIAGLDRINGAWLFFFAALALPTALLVMTILPTRGTPYVDEWSFLADWWVRWLVAGALLLVSLIVLRRLVGKALGGWEVPWGVQGPRGVDS